MQRHYVYTSRHRRVWNFPEVSRQNGKELFVCIVVLFGCFFDIWVFFFVAVCVAALFKSLNRSTMINFKVGVEI